MPPAGLSSTNPAVFPNYYHIALFVQAVPLPGLFTLRQLTDPNAQRILTKRRLNALAVTRFLYPDTPLGIVPILRTEIRSNEQLYVFAHIEAAIVEEIKRAASGFPIFLQLFLEVIHQYLGCGQLQPYGRFNADRAEHEFDPAARAIFRQTVIEGLHERYRVSEAGAGDSGGRGGSGGSPDAELSLEARELRLYQQVCVRGVSH
jgi:hypothetical protein